MKEMLMGIRKDLVEGRLAVEIKGGGDNSGKGKGGEGEMKDYRSVCREERYRGDVAEAGGMEWGRKRE